MRKRLATLNVRRHQRTTFGRLPLTLRGMKGLDDGAARNFRNNGVVVVRRFFDQGTITKMTRALEAYQHETVSRLPNSFYVREANSKELRGLWWMNIFSPFFADLLQAEPLLDCVYFLTGWQPRPMFVEAFMKPAQCGGRIPLHQDIAYSAVSPHQQATIWAPIDRVRIANGAVRYLAGSHRDGLKSHRMSDVHGSSLEVDGDIVASARYPEVVYELNPGDIIVHDGLTMHYSNANNSQTRRRAIALGYRGHGTGFSELII
ncbi:Phytanoyl-CoA dioxygenase (PhyH) [Rhodospirillales bacterium URHD0017]|nr:Phytanoyl-CoA dioxygenase (PhyH) [Rhodospirillales bacterium URHD0017]